MIGSASFPLEKGIFKGEDAYFASHKALPVRVFFAVGSEEQMADDPEVSDLRAFTAQLRGHSYQGLEFDTQIFDAESHVSVIPTTISRGLRYIYASPTTDATATKKQ